MPAPNARGPTRCDQSFRVTKANAAFWPWPEKLKPNTADHAFDFRLLEDEAFHLLHHLQGALLGGTRRQLHVRR